MCAWPTIEVPGGTIDGWLLCVCDTRCSSWYRRWMEEAGDSGRYQLSLVSAVCLPYTSTVGW